MDYEELKNYASECQLSADEMALKLIEQENIFGLIGVVQSICDFNLYWFYSISPGITVHESSLIFLSENIKQFKRKLELNKYSYYDFVINSRKPVDFKQFKKEICLIKKYLK